MPSEQHAALRELVSDMNAGRVQMLVIIGESNPVQTAPADLNFADAMSKVQTRFHSGLFLDETATLCHWHVPAAHFLEAWSDARTVDGTVSIVQPLIQPMYGGKSAHEIVQTLLDRPERNGYDLVREYWMAQPQARACAAMRRVRCAGCARRAGAAPHRAGRRPATAAGTQPAGSTSPRRCRRAAAADAGTARGRGVREARGGRGCTTASSPAPRSPRHAHLSHPLHPRTGRTRRTCAPVAPGAPVAPAFEVNFRRDPTIYDGRFANNGWLQELPKPVTKLTWDNAALIAPATAERLDLENGDIIEVTHEGRQLRVPVWINPGHAQDAITIHVGYGRTRAGRVGNATGFNAYVLRGSSAPWFGAAEVVDDRRRLSPGEHAGSLDASKAATSSARRRSRSSRRSPTFAQGDGAPEARQAHLALSARTNTPARSGAWRSTSTPAPAAVRAWSPARPRTTFRSSARSRSAATARCTGCASTATTPAPLDNPDTFMQPMPCQQCENAPCEVVCPVAATVHSDEGLNDMVYNRCVGTRYCSNNCPWKVRRFNFLLYQDWNTPTFKLQRNPDVTVRSRGVMEKCTYCVQRINAARIQAKREDRDIRDGEMLTACQSVCPTDSIVFGNINDPNEPRSRS